MRDRASCAPNSPSAEIAWKQKNHHVCRGFSRGSMGPQGMAAATIFRGAMRRVLRIEAEGFENAEALDFVADFSVGQDPCGGVGWNNFIRHFGHFGRFSC